MSIDAKNGEVETILWPDGSVSDLVVGSVAMDHVRIADQVPETEDLKQPQTKMLLDSLFDPTDGQDWQERALCAQTDPEAFFPEKGGSNAEAKRICLSCEVRSECLQDALDRDERFGVWGGMSEHERRKLKKRST